MAHRACRQRPLSDRSEVKGFWRCHAQRSIEALGCKWTGEAFHARAKGTAYHACRPGPRMTVKAVSV